MMHHTPDIAFLTLRLRYAWSSLTTPPNCDFPSPKKPQRGGIADTGHCTVALLKKLCVFYIASANTSLNCAAVLLQTAYASWGIFSFGHVRAEAAKFFAASIVPLKPPWFWPIWKFFKPAKSRWNSKGTYASWKIKATRPHMTKPKNDPGYVQKYCGQNWEPARPLKSPILAELKIFRASSVFQRAICIFLRCELGDLRMYYLMRTVNLC